MKLCLLGQSYKKIALISQDRNIEIHAQYGKHFKIRTPRVGRDLLFNKPTAELLVASSGNQIFRLNLEEGRFMK